MTQRELKETAKNEMLELIGRAAHATVAYDAHENGDKTGAFFSGCAEVLLALDHITVSNNVTVSNE